MTDDYTDLACITHTKPSCPYKEKVEEVKKKYPAFDLDSHIDDLLKKSDA